MREIVSTAAFRKDFKRVSRSGRHDMALLKEAISLLAGGETLPERFRDHPLGSNWQGCRDCHLRPDWLLIYKLAPEALTLVRTGSHAELFD
ncbi:MAG: type II toxin-antitoxin system YafQ family toxin [Humidesulfovibrio sp.]|nr:type II toxin-antitoxin system YafQ family toxin [Humidesulfovibrio sp.]